MKINLNVNIIFHNLIKKKYQTIETLASSLRITTKSIKNYLNGASISFDTCKKLFELINAANYDLFDVLNLEDNSFYYHMSAQGIHGKISSKYNEGAKYNDFGYGFYLSESFKVAATYIKNSDNPHIYCFKRNRIDILKPYFFKETDKGTIEWVLYIGFNRQKITDPIYKTIINENLISQLKNKKCLVGKIADSLNFNVMDEFFKNNYDIFQVKSQLIKANLGLQYVIKDEKACNKLICDKEYILDKNIIYLITKWHEKRNQQLREDNKKTIDLNSSKQDYKFNKIIERITNE